MVRLSGLEPPTSRLSGVRSNQLSYRPSFNRCFGFILRRYKSQVSSAYCHTPAGLTFRTPRLKPKQQLKTS